MAGNRIFFNTRLGKTTSRLSAIMYFTVRRAFSALRERSRNEPGLAAGTDPLQQAFAAVASRTGLSALAVETIYEGASPTIDQLEVIVDKTRWDIFFLLGIDQRAFKESRAVVFKELGLSTPSSEDHAAFRRLYIECHKDLELAEERDNDE